MRLLLAIIGLLLPALQLPAGTIDPSPVDVSTATTQWLNPEDKLLFTVAEWGYQINASAQGLSPYPTHVAFQFITAPQTGPADFTAILESRDGTVSVDFPGTFSWLPGWTGSSGYTGPVSVLYGSMDLSAALSEELFTCPSAVLVLENQGGNVLAGLPPYTLGEDLSLSFSASGFGVSGPVVEVRYLDPPAGVPEPNPGLLVPIVGALFGAARKGASRWSRRREQIKSQTHG
jgi:hypothetical protein